MINPVRLLIGISIALFMCISVYDTAYGKRHKKKDTRIAYDFSFTTIDGKPLSLSDYEGKVILIVNTASYCGFTPQYKALEELYQTYKNDGLIIIGVPSNDFGKQEPGSSEEVACFVEDHYPITFILTEKEHVRGKKAHPFYVWAKKKAGFFGLGRPFWNFHKYIVARDGTLFTWFPSATSPMSPRFRKAIECALNG